MLQHYDFVTSIGSTAEPLQLYLTDDGDEIDLTGASVSVLVVSSTDRSVVLIDEAGAGDSSSLCSYDLQDADVATAGLYLIRWTVVLDDGRQYVSPWLTWRIRS